jgi:hypothetical protein
MRRFPSRTSIAALVISSLWTTNAALAQAHQRFGEMRKPYLLY